MAGDREPLLFRFVCPECGVGDEDFGHLVTHDDPHCTVCFMDDGRIVRLRRWTGEEGRPDAATKQAVKKARGRAETG